MLDLPAPALFGQLLLGAINGAFYALLSLGLAVIFGLLHVVNFAHGAQYALGAFCAYLLLKFAGVPYWGALILSPLIVGLLGSAFERLFLRRLYDVDNIYQLLLTFSLALIIEGTLRALFGSSGFPYENPLPGGINLGFMFMPYYRAWVVAVSIVLCVATWLVIEKTKLGSYLRAATERPDLVRTFGINVPLMVTVTYGAGAALAAFAGVLAAPIYQVNPGMGANLLIIVFAVVVIGGMGSLMGSVVAGFGLGLLEGLTKLVYPTASSTVIFVVMALVLLLRPAGLAGREVH
ncbi:branched-chain amino acid ABC transporter permease [Bradyrhizobium sp. LHD-71]|uniref:branched-chain amino acid ABC transporter permease n=1 Tax=Bradyrhizobium sp. LHD-71 TaxID=3072141 RepID=UPI0028105517|nr:branched-chain amino acid ABC transporter permease [Bradyrhizobium sp. LHD-71]MDQ8731957.1 branched-chain amino acid ABC transporter permease [Bradyrhizobium sp. LHD-71]